MRSINAAVALTLVITLLELVMQPVAAEEAKWLCLPIAATGFKWKDGAWSESSFRVDQDKYIVSQRANPPGYSVSELGEQQGTECKDIAGNGTILTCDWIEEWRINLSTLRYLRVYMAGFWNGVDSSDNTPLVEIGKCSKL